MADNIVTKQQLIDAGKNADSWEKYWSGNEDEDVITRLNKEYPTHAKALKILMENGGLQPFETQDQLLASIPIVNPTAAKALDTKKVWIWKQTSAESVEPKIFEWIDTGLSELELGKSYTDKHVKNTLEKSTKYQSINTGNSEVIPIVTDNNNSILIGYNMIDKKVVAEGVLNETDFYKSGLRGIQTNTETQIHPIVLDAVGNVILGYSTASNSLVGSFDETGSNYQYKAEKFPYALVPNAWNQSITYGQSLSDGGGLGVTAISLTQPYSNLTFQGGVRVRAGGNFSSSKPLVEAGVETITSGFANYAIKSAIEKNGIKPSDHVLFSSACGASGTPIEDLSKGSDWWNQQFVPHIWGAYPLNNNTTIQCVCWLQGEANSGDNGASYQRTRQQYKTLLLQLLNDINAETDQITPQTTPTIMLSYQHSSYAKLNNGGTQLGVLDACKEDDRIYFVAPTYAFPHLPDKLHLTSVSYKWLGAYFGRAYQQMMFDKIRPKSIKPLSALYQANKVTVTFDVPHAPLQFNTARLAQTQNFGFAVKKSNGTLYTITSVEIIDAVKVVITCSENITSGSVVRYALDYNTDLKEGATGNLFDSCADSVVIEGEEKPMQYACPHFEISTYTEVI